MKKPKEILVYFFLLFKRFFPLWRLYGFPVAFGSLIFPFCHLFGRYKPYIALYKHKAILKYLKKRYTVILMKYTNNIETAQYAIKPDSTIWVCW